MPTSRARSTPTPISPANATLVSSPRSHGFVPAAAVFTSLIAAGSCGLIGHPLRHALTMTCALIIAAAAIGQGPRSFRRTGLILLFLLLAMYLASSSLMVVCALGVVVLVGGITFADPDSQSSLAPIVFALFTFALYRLAHDSVATIWLFADSMGHGLAHIGGILAGRPLDTGATFASVDSLILMIALGAAWIANSPSPRLRRGTILFAAIGLSHILYLVILANCNDLLDVKPITAATITVSPEGLLALLRDQIPWNLPILAAIFHSMVTFFLFKWSDTSARTSPPRTTLPFIPVITASLAILLPVVSVLSWSRTDLNGKTIVFYKLGFLNWMSPKWDEYGRLSQGMYGLLANSSIDMQDGIGGTGSRFLELFGANAIVSPELSNEDLKKADALVMLYPDKPWKPGQVDRIKQYVKDGGTLLVFGEHTVQDKKDDPDPNRPRWPDEAIARFNELLVDSNMRVRFDTGVFTVGGWLQSYESLSHPMTLGVRDDRNEFGAVIGGSLHVRWPAQPLIVGRFGHNDPGDPGRPDHAMLGNEKYDPGEQLGDVILAAEQRVGKGRIVLFGDTSMMSNGLLHGCYDFNARLLGYISNHGSTPQNGWRQMLSVLLLLGLLATLIIEPHPIRLTACALLLAASLSMCTQISYRRATMLPGPPVEKPSKSKLVYIDTSHMEAASLESWRDEGLMGLQLCFEREGYMTLGLEEFTKERLDRAAVLVSVAPAKPFSDDERALIRDWVRRGGIFISTVGYDRVAGSQQLLADFGLYVGARPGEPAPEPLGWFKSPYLDLGSYKPHVRFWAAWPLVFNSLENQPEAQPVALGGDDKPAIIKRNFGEGKVVLVGDTEFAMNKNTERETGQAFEGMRENADFWHWFIESLTDVEHPWTPTDPTTQATTQPTASIQSEVTR